MKKNLLMMVVLSILVFVSCKKQVEPVVVSPYHVGQVYGGGYVFYIDPSGQHGLIVSRNDVPSTIPFSTRIYPFFNGTRFGEGQSNTLNIINIIKENNGFFYAAKYLGVYGSGGRFDWYLPSKDELNVIYNNKSGINWTENEFGKSVYWSSSNDSPTGTKVWVQDFNTGKQTLANQMDTCSVRAIRNF